MTTPAEWRERGQILFDAANRLQQKAEDLKAEAVRLRDVACRCGDEAMRLDDLERK